MAWETIVTVWDRAGIRNTIGTFNLHLQVLRCRPEDLKMDYDWNIVTYTTSEPLQASARKEAAFRRFQDDPRQVRPLY